MAPEIQVTIDKDRVILTDYKAANTRGLQNAIQGEEVELCLCFMNPFMRDCRHAANCRRVHLFNAGQLLFDCTGKTKYKSRRWSKNAVAHDDSSRPPRRSGPVTFGQAPPAQRVAYSVPLPSYNLPFDEDLLPRNKAEALENRFRFAVDGPDQRQTLKQLGCGFHSADEQIDLLLKQRLHDTSEFLSASPTLSRDADINARRLLHQLQYVEECKMTIVLLQYSQENISITSCRTTNFPNAFEVPAAGVTENRPSVLRGDRIEASIHGRNRWHVGFVHFVQLDKLIVSFDAGSDVARNWHNSSFDMIFSVGNRTQQRNIHRAIDYGFLLSRESILKLENCKTFGALENKNRSLKPQLLSYISKCDSFPPTQLLNPEQQKFVATVGSRNLSLLRGPPGTGKTSSVVASILFTLNRASQQQTRVKMLIACPSNAACDLIVERLAEADVKYGLGMFRRPVSGSHGRFGLLRIHALSRDPSTVAQCVKNYSRSTGPSFHFPERGVDLLDDVDIVVVTLATAGKLLGVGVPTRDSFSHVFVDEAGQVTEQELLLATTFVTPGKTTLALAGDERQLGPIIHSGLCKEGGMQLSAFERLVHPSVAPQSAVVNLIRNYRSLAPIVHIVNVSYSDQLEAARKDAFEYQYTSKQLPWMQGFIHSSSRSLLCNTNGKPVWTNRAKENFPDHSVAFIHNEGPESRDPDSPSWKNVSEKDIVVNLVKSLINDGGVDCEDITVLTPYLLQRKKIEASLHHHCFVDGTIKVPSKYFNDRRPRCPIQVATVEAFQGKENKIIIVSCVRSSQADTKQVTTDIRHKLGFFSQVQRTNVALSRARDAMFVIGNAKLFLQDYSRHAGTIIIDDDGEPQEHQNPLWDEVLNRIDGYGCILNMQSQSGGNLKTIKNQLRGRSGRDFQIGEINSDEEENTEGAAVHNYQ